MDETVNPQGNESPQEPFNPEAAFESYLERQATGAVDDGADPQQQASDGDAKPDESAQDDANEQRFTVKVNGEEREVSLAELQKGYQLESDYRIKTSQAAEQARAAQEQFAQAQAMQQHYGAQLQQYQQRLAQMQPAQPDPSLIDSDPVNYLRQQQAWQAWQGQMMRTQQEAQAFTAQQEARKKQYFEQQVSEQAQLLAKADADFSDPAKAEQVKQGLAKYLKSTGYSDEEVSGVTDHRAVVLAKKAMLYDQMMVKQQNVNQKVVNLPPRAPQRPGVSNVSPTDGRTRAMQSLKRSGSIDDAANAFAAMLGGR